MNRTITFEQNKNIQEQIIRALNKMTPMKVEHKATLQKCCTCASCGNVIDEFTEFNGAKCRVTYAFCHFCGQALDWSDEI